jgi:hypothetical protein
VTREGGESKPIKILFTWSKNSTYIPIATPQVTHEQNGSGHERTRDKMNQKQLCLLTTDIYNTHYSIALQGSVREERRRQNETQHCPDAIIDAVRT